ncbi:MAG TPA: zinc ribbon domain-containing protein [Lacipirellulaceae bacterium]|jgi:putative FmdB family regulatory protein
MPIYEYICQDCDREVEILVHAGNKPECPECGSAKMTKLLSVVAAPTRDSSTGMSPGQSPGSCGPGCGCHPH